VPGIVPPSFDGLVLAAVAREVRAYVGARFAGVRQPDPEAIVVGLRDARTAGHLHCSIHARTARVHLAARPETTERLGPFGQLLRSRLAEAHLTGVEQPPFDRVLRLNFEALEGPLVLVAEIMGRYSNLILLDARVVLGALKVVTAQMSPRRPVLPGRPYAPPPADRPRPDQLEPGAVRALCEGARPLWQQLSGAVVGLGPVLAREVALRAGVDPGVPASAAADAAPRLAAALGQLAEIRRAEQFAPTVYEADGRVVAFGAIPLRAYSGLASSPAASMSEAVDRYYRGVGETSPLEERRRGLAASVRAALRQRERALDSNRAALAESREAERLRVMGELLLTYGHGAAPRATSIAVPDHTAGGEDVTIPLDPALTVVENAQRLFRRYAKAQATSRALPARIVRLEADALALREALVQIETASSGDDLWEVQTDLVRAKLLRRAPRSRPAARTGPRRYAAPGGAILVGRSASENDQVTFHLAGPDDLWFHARGLAGAHVILKTDGAPSAAAIEVAAKVAAHFSEGRLAGTVAVDYVARKHVRKPRGAGPGTVLYAEERTLRVEPALPPATRAPR